MPVTHEEVARWTTDLIRSHWHPSACFAWHDWATTKGDAAILIALTLSATEFIARGMGTIPQDVPIQVLPVAPPPEEVAEYDAETRALYDGEQLAIRLFICHVEADNAEFNRLLTDLFTGTVDEVSERLAFTMGGLMALQHTAFHHLAAGPGGVAVPAGMEDRAAEVLHAFLEHEADIASLPETDGPGQ